MDHSFFKERLSALADNELAPNERVPVEEHVHRCAECRAELDRLRQLGRLVTRHSELNDSDYWEKAAQKIEARLPDVTREVIDLPAERQKAGLGLWWKLPAIAASVIIVGYIGLHEDEILTEEVIPEPIRLNAPQVQPTDEIGDETEAPMPSEIRTGVETEGMLADRTEPEAIKSLEDDRADYLRDADRSTDGASQMEKPVDRLARLQPEKKPDQDNAVSSPAPGDDNYKLRGGRVATTTLAPSRATEGFVQMPTEETDFKILKMQAEVGDLDHWRRRRDSLLLLIPGSSLPSSRSRAKESSKTESGTGRKTVADLSLSSVAPGNVAPAPADLLEAWYWICRLSNDSVETARGIGYLRKVAADKQSPDRPKADSLLQLIENQ